MQLCRPHHQGTTRLTTRALLRGVHTSIQLTLYPWLHSQSNRHILDTPPSPCFFPFLSCTMLPL